MNIYKCNCKDPNCNCLELINSDKKEEKGLKGFIEKLLDYILRPLYEE